MRERAERILLAEDSKFLRRAYEHVLQKAGYVVITAQDGEEALTLARTKRPDLIILDMLLPKMPGLEVLRMLKQDRRVSGIPVIVLSGLPQNTESKLKMAGAVAYYEKTNLLPEHLGHMVQRVLDRSTESVDSELHRA